MKEKKKAWTWFSIYIRLKYSDRDGMVSCYTCNKKAYWKGEGIQAGHFVGGRNNAVLLDEEQVRPQCYSCNCGRSGEQYTFGKNLEKEYGEKKVKELRKKRFEVLKMSKKDWKEKEDFYKNESLKIAKKKNITL